MNYAPIALFAYNRVDHLKKTIEALQKNTLSAESALYIFSDAAKTEKDLAAVSQVRAFIKTVTGFKSVQIIEQEKNQGLANSIITGVTRLTHEFGRVIVLEDDIVTSPQFLRFMNEALNRYENEPTVMHISGYNFPMSSETDAQTYFIAPATCWGWATWARAWKYFKKDTATLIPKFNNAMIKDFNLNNANPYFLQLEKNHQGTMNTWAIFWYAAVYLNHGLSLHPVQSYCFNIGHDGTGEHCSNSNAFDVSLNQNPITKWEDKIDESPYFRKKVEEFFRSTRQPLSKRVLNKITKLLGIAG